jgi:hypothetical protein
VEYATAEGVTGQEYGRVKPPIRPVEEFRARGESGAVAKFLNEGRSPVHAEKSEERRPDGGRAINATYRAGHLFLLRDAIGDEATVCTAGGAVYWKRLKTFNYSLWR